MIQTVYPSVVPQNSGLRYGDFVLSPVVIESLGHPITNPRTDEGLLTQVSVQATIATLTALDRRDIQQMYL